MITACIILAHLVTVPEPGKPRQPDRPWRVYRGGAQSNYGAPEPIAARRTFGGAGTVFIQSSGSLYLRETPDEIDRKPCHEPEGPE